MSIVTVSNVEQAKSVKLPADITSIIVTSLGTAPFYPVTKDELPNIRSSRIFRDYRGSLWIQSKISGGGGGGDVDLTDVYKALDNKVDRVVGKGLSQNDFTDDYRYKLASYTLITSNTVSVISFDKLAIDLSDGASGKQVLVNNATLVDGDYFSVICLASPNDKSLFCEIVLSSGLWFGQLNDVTTLQLFGGQSVTVEKINGVYVITTSSGEFTLV